MTDYTILQSIPDATLEGYERDSSRSLRLGIRTWNDDVVELVASELSHLEDAGTWEVDALVALQTDGDDGWGIIDTEGNVTLRILASGLAGLPSDDEGGGSGELM